MSRLLFQGIPGGRRYPSRRRRSHYPLPYLSTYDLLSAEALSTLHEECGVVAIHGHADAARMAYLGLYALQHRGQESAGIATADGHHLANIKGMGLVSEIFTDEVLQKLPGADGYRSHSLFDNRRFRAFKCAADSRGFDQGLDRDCA